MTLIVCYEWCQLAIQGGCWWQSSLSEKWLQWRFLGGYFTQSSWQKSRHFLPLSQEKGCLIKELLLQKPRISLCELVSFFLSLLSPSWYVGTASSVFLRVALLGLPWCQLWSSLVGSFSSSFSQSSQDSLSCPIPKSLRKLWLLQIVFLVLSLTSGGQAAGQFLERLPSPLTQSSVARVRAKEISHLLAWASKSPHWDSDSLSEKRI